MRTRKAHLGQINTGDPQPVIVTFAGDMLHFRRRYARKSKIIHLGTVVAAVEGHTVECNGHTHTLIPCRAGLKVNQNVIPWLDVVEMINGQKVLI